MIKKVITLLMCFSLFINLLTINATEDDSYEKKYLPVLCLNDHQSTYYEVLVKDRNIYMGIKDVQKLIQYERILFDQYDGNKVVKYYRYDVNYDYDVGIEITNEYIKTNYGTYDYEGMMISDDGEIYLELYDLLNILKIKTSIMDEKVVITLPKYTIFDFYAKDFLKYGYVTAIDLLEPGESTINSAFFDSLTVLVNNFDEKLFVPGWGTDVLNDELTMKALLTLNQDDEIFYSEDTEEIVDLKLQENGMSELLATGEDLASILSLGETIDSVEELLEQVTNLTQDGKDMLETYQKMINWNGKEFDGLIQMKAFAKYGNNISNVMSIADIFVSGYEIYKRANNWEEYALADLDNLKNIDVNNYTKGKNIVKHIKQNAEKAYEENKNAMEAGINEGAQEAFDILATEALGLIPVAGMMIKITTLAVNVGKLIAKMDENVVKEMDRAQLSAMVNNLIDICSVSRLESLLVYNPYVSKKEDAQLFISKTRTTLKANMRAWCYLYYLRSSSDKETKYSIQQAKNNVSNMVAMLELLNIAEDYLYIFDEESTVYCEKEQMKEVLNSNHSSYKEKYYSLLKREIEDIRENYTTNHFAEYEKKDEYHFVMRGISYLDLIDFDGDGIEECIVVYEDSKYGKENPKYATEIYTYHKESQVILEKLSMVDTYQFGTNGLYCGLKILTDSNGIKNLMCREVYGSGPFSYTCNIYTVKNSHIFKKEKLEQNEDTFINDEKVSQEEFNNRINYWDNECTAGYIPYIGMNNQVNLMDSAIERTKEVAAILGIDSGNKGSLEINNNNSFSQEEIIRILKSHYSEAYSIDINHLDVGLQCIDDGIAVYDMRRTDLQSAYVLVDSIRVDENIGMVQDSFTTWYLSDID